MGTCAQPSPSKSCVYCPHLCRSVHFIPFVRCRDLVLTLFVPHCSDQTFLSVAEEDEYSLGLSVNVSGIQFFSPARSCQLSSCILIQAGAPLPIS